MSFFKDFKEDLSQAVNELVPDEEMTEGFDEEQMVNTLEEEEVDITKELVQLNTLIDTVEEAEIPQQMIPVEEEEKIVVKIEEEEEAPVIMPTLTREEPVMNVRREESVMDFTNKAEELGQPSGTITVITSGTRIIGSIESEGSIEVDGIVEGNITCNGKITITGAVKGDMISSEFYADAARIEGEVSSNGTVKIGAGSVIVGNINATSAVVAGAIKGDIDVNGPVVVDTSAVVVGNIKSRSVQINNGAVIDGFCSQSYADVDIKGIFGE